MVNQAAQHELQGSPQAAFAEERQHRGEQSQGCEGEGEGHEAWGERTKGAAADDRWLRREEPQVAVIADAKATSKTRGAKSVRSRTAQRTALERRKSVPAEANVE